MNNARRRRWADVVLIVAAVYSLLAAAWAPLELLSGGGGGEVTHTGFLWVSYTVGGVLGLLAIFMARRRAGLAKAAAALGGIVVLSGFFSLDELTALAVISLGGTGLAMLLTAPFVGAMPSPEEEGKERLPAEPTHRHPHTGP